MLTMSVIKNFLPTILASIAIILGTASNFYCETVSFDNEDGKLYAGIFSYRAKNNNYQPARTTCQSYTYLKDNLGYDYDIDGKTVLIRVFAVLTVLLGALVLFFACFGSLYTMSQQRWRTMGIAFIITGIFQSVTLLILSSSICSNNPTIQYNDYSNNGGGFNDDGSNRSCETATGFGVNVTSVILWLMAGICTFILSPPTVQRNFPVQNQTVSYQRSPDGTIQETDVVVVQGKPVAA